MKYIKSKRFGNTGNVKLGEGTPMWVPDQNNRQGLDGSLNPQTFYEGMKKLPPPEESGSAFDRLSKIQGDLTEKEIRTCKYCHKHSVEPINKIIHEDHEAECLKRMQREAQTKETGDKMKSALSIGKALLKERRKQQTRWDSMK